MNKFNKIIITCSACLNGNTAMTYMNFTQADQDGDDLIAEDEFNSAYSR